MKMLLVMAAWIPIADVTVADDGELGKEQIAKWAAYYEARAAAYDIRLQGDSDESLRLHQFPVLRWSNPVIDNGTTHGECFVWTKSGRPEVFASIFSYRSSRARDQTKRTVAHAFNSLSRQALVASHAGEVFWAPDQPGAEFLPIPDAPSPGSTRPLRLVQMRRLAREFTATSGGTDGDEELGLRLLPQPVYRHTGESEDVLDGALFVFVTGTDPEVLLMIEVRRVGSESLWHAVAARHSHLTLRVQHRGIEVWQYLRGSRIPTPPLQHTYRSQHGIDIRDRLLP